MSVLTADVRDLRFLLEFTFSELTNQQLLKILSNLGINLPADTCRANILNIYCEDLVSRGAAIKTKHSLQTLSGDRPVASASILLQSPSTPTAPPIPKSTRSFRQVHDNSIDQSLTALNASGPPSIEIESYSSLVNTTNPSSSSDKRKRGVLAASVKAQARLARLEEIKVELAANNLGSKCITGRPTLDEQVGNIESQLRELMEVIRTQRKSSSTKPSCTERLQMIARDMSQVHLELDYLKKIHL